MPLVDRIFARVGASDNIARGHSTFMVEMQETANILHTATSRSLVVLDEIGRGTATFDGLSIAWAVAEHLATNPRLRPKTLFATHYHELTDLADATPGVVNFHVAAREWKDDIIFLRKIVPGRSDRSYGIQVARLAGLPPLGHRPRARDSQRARARRADARRPAVGQRHADRTAAAARAVPGAAGRRSAARRGSPPLDVDRHDAARGADAARRAEEGRGANEAACLALAPARAWSTACGRASADSESRTCSSSAIPSGPEQPRPAHRHRRRVAEDPQLIFDNLMELDDHLRVVPKLAERLDHPDAHDLRRHAAGTACAFTTATS